MPGVINRPVSIFTTGDVALASGVETVVLTTPGVNTDGPGQTVRLLGSLQLSTGVGATATTLRWRRGSLTGTLVGEANAITTAASSTFTLAHAVDDAPGEVASQVYVLTAQVTGGTGTCLAGEALVIVAS